MISAGDIESIYIDQGEDGKFEVKALVAIRKKGRLICGGFIHRAEAELFQKTFEKVFLT